MKRLGFGALLSFLLVGSLAAQNGSKRVDLKEITDGQFRQVTELVRMISVVVPIDCQIIDGTYYISPKRQQ